MRQVERRLVRRAADGSLSDLKDGAPATLDDLRADIRLGRYFRATDADTGSDCTNDVLAEVIKTAVPEIEASLLTMYQPLLRLLGEDDARG